MNYLKTFLPYIFGNKKGKSFLLPNDIDFSALKFEELLMFHTLKHSLEEFTNTLTISELAPLQVYHLFSFEEFLPDEFFDRLKSRYSHEYDLFKTATKGEVLKTEALQELLDHKNYKLSVFALFHSDRSKPGKMFIRKADGRFVHKANGDLWSMNVLGLSGRGLPFNHSNGMTPCGVFSIDSVMPEADKNDEFGKFRRLIVNFLQKSPNEENIKQFLPKSHHGRAWWTPSIVGRELGRSLLRIHGTGRINKNPFSSYFPMIASSGCLTTSEGILGVVEINHQRKLLDTLMSALEIPVSYENESKIHGVLYVVDFNGTYQALEFRS